MKRIALLACFSALLLIGAGPTYGAVDMFIKIDGIDGESQDNAHRNEIDVLSFSWGVTRPIPSGGGGGASVPVRDDLVIAKTLDKSSPKLFLACARGEHIPTVVLTARRAGGERPTFLVIELTNVLVSSYQTGGSSGDTIPTESVSLNFEEIKISYTPQRPDGSSEKPVEASFNFKENTGN